MKGTGTLFSAIGECVNFFKAEEKGKVETLQVKRDRFFSSPLFKLLANFRFHTDSGSISRQLLLSLATLLLLQPKSQAFGVAQQSDRLESNSQNPEEFVVAQQSDRVNAIPLLRDTKQALKRNTETEFMRSGTELIWNGEKRSLNWSAWQDEENSSQIRYGIVDADLMRVMGIELLNTEDSRIQPVRWFSSEPLELATRWIGQRRYLDITELAERLGWEVSIEGQSLSVFSTPASVEGIRQEALVGGDRLIVELTDAASFQVSATAIAPPPESEDPDPDGVRGDRQQPLQEFVVTIDANVTPTALNASAIVKENLAENLATNAEESLATEIPFQLQQTGMVGSIAVESDRPILRFQIPQTWQPRVWTESDPKRLIVDIQPDSIAERNIVWAPGVRWREDSIALDSDRFSVVWLELNPNRSSAVQIKPITANSGLPGIALLSEISEGAGANAAINGGFFNRNNQLPLGAIRREGLWLSSPILNRGAIAWNDAGSAIVGRLSVEETLTNSAGETLPVLFRNSGYVKAGVSRYTPDWGATYTPLIDNEIIVVVERGMVTNHLRAGTAGEESFAIPEHGYLLTLRSFQSALPKLAIGTSVRIDRRTEPAYFEAFPNILGAGPVLLRNGAIVLDAKAEQFNENFTEGRASRSAIAQREDGTLLITIVHHRIDGPGPTLTEMAQILQRLGAMNALNLDGGGSTTLYLGGQLLQHPPRIVPRIHNGLGIFFEGNGE